MNQKNARRCYVGAMNGPSHELMLGLSEIQEAAFARQMFESGLILLTHYRSSEDYPGFIACCSLATEKLAKLTILLSDEDNHQATFKFAKGKGHDLSALDKQAKLRMLENLGKAAHRPLVEDAIRASLRNSLSTPLTELMTIFGMNGRYYHLDVIKGENRPSDQDPSRLWREVLDRIALPDGYLRDASPRDIVRFQVIRVAQCLIDWWEFYRMAWVQGTAGERANQLSSEIRLTEARATLEAFGRSRS